MSTNKKNIIIQVSGYPYKISASNAKNELFAKALSLAGYNTYLVSKSKLNGKHSVGKRGRIIFKFFNIKENSNKISSYFFTKVNEIIFLKRIKKKSDNLYYFVSYNLFFEIIFYWFLSKIIGFKLIINIMEWHKAIAYKSSLQKFNAYLFDTFSFAFADGTITISDFILNKIKKRYPKHKIIKIPVLTDYYFTENIKETKLDYKHFLYCGDIGYIEVINFIINSYTIFIKNTESKVKLSLVLSGDVTAIDTFKNKIDNSKLRDKVIILTKLKYHDLISMYKSAICLLIPLRKTEQDLARFPHKIGEYSSTGVPILSTNWGELSNYFIDKQSIYFAKEYREEEYAKKLEEITVNSNNKEIGIKAKHVCLDNFHFSNYNNILDNFLKTL